MWQVKKAKLLPLHLQERGDLEWLYNNARSAQEVGDSDTHI